MMTGREGTSIGLFFSGDVMTGRGIDQALPHVVPPQLYERYIKDARDYLALVHRGGRPIDTPVTYDWIWGDALKVWQERQPDAKIINLETSITLHNEAWPGKGIHYRMHPENVRLFQLAGIDVCCLANNHILDWNRAGLVETMETLHGAGIKTAGAGEDLEQSEQPALIQTPKKNIVVYSAGHASSGVPAFWAASEERSGLNYLENLDDQSIRNIHNQIRNAAEASDAVIVYSIHWGSNWGYEIPPEHKGFAHRLIDETGVDVVYGHSSHHPRGFEVYRNHLILYGAGDLINDYEGIGGKESFRDDLVLMYFPEIDPGDGSLISMDLVPMQIRQFSLHHAREEDSDYLLRLLQKESHYPGYSLDKNPKGIIRLTMQQ